VKRHQSMVGGESMGLISNLKPSVRLVIVDPRTANSAFFGLRCAGCDNCDCGIG